MKLLLMLSMLLFIFTFRSMAQQQTGLLQHDQAFDNIDVSQIKDLVKTPHVVILDVRTPEETAMGKIENAIEANIKDPASFDSAIEKLDKSKTYIVYCRSGRRSVAACNQMKEKGFDSLYNLQGGFNAYKDRAVEQ